MTRTSAPGAAALLTATGLVMCSIGLVASLVAIRADVEGFGLITTGLVMSSYYVGLLIGAFQAPRIVRAAGHIRTYAALASLLSGAVLVHLLAVHPTIWVVARTATGFAGAGLFVVVESWLNEIVPNTVRGRVLALFAAVSMTCLLYTSPSPRDPE